MSHIILHGRTCSLCRASATPSPLVSLVRSLHSGRQVCNAAPPDVKAVNLRPEQLPKHLAVICDGNARWAAERGHSHQYGHRMGVEALIRVIECCLDWGIPALTTYGFSIENWKRDKIEVDFLMTLFASSLELWLPKFMERGVRLHIIGQSHALPDFLRGTLERAMQATESNDQLHFTLALSYTGRNDLANAAKQLAQMCKDGKLEPNQIDEELLAQQLSTCQVSSLVGPPDLLIRSSGEKRLSNFLLWELAYTELYFADVHWPAVDAEVLAAALHDYAHRERRFGGRGSAQQPA